MSLEQLNEILSRPIPLPQSDELSSKIDSDEDLVRRFIGPNADRYMASWERFKDKSVWQMGMTRGRGEWHWPAFLFFLPWAFYRKLWLYAGVYFFVAVATSLLIPSGGTFDRAVRLGMSLFAGQMSRGIYARHADSKVKKLKTTSQSEVELLTRIDKLGGVSIGGAIAGTIVMIGALALMIVSITSHTVK